MLYEAVTRAPLGTIAPGHIFIITEEETATTQRTLNCAVIDDYEELVDKDVLHAALCNYRKPSPKTRSIDLTQDIDVKSNLGVDPCPN